jgi:hypothetical protein
MPQHIHEGSVVKVRAKVSKGEAKASDFKFKFLKDGKEFKQEPGQAPKARPDNETADKRELTDEGWIEASCTLPDVEADKDSYQMTYQVVHGSETKTDFPSFTVWPKTGTLKVKNAKEPAKGLPHFEFKLMQGGKQMGDARNVLQEDGSIKFDLAAGNGFSIDPVTPWKIPTDGWETQTGRNRVCKGDVDFKADFLAPLKGSVKQYVNLASDPAAATVGQDGIGRVIRIKVGVEGDADRPAEKKLARAGMVVHVRVTFGPGAGGTYEKSLRTDTAAKTEVKNELELSGATGPDASNVYKAKVTLKADGTGEMKVYLGLSGGDTCKIEIAGSDRFLTEATVAADAVLTVTNWRKLYYELLAPDFYETRELEAWDDPATKTNHKDFPSTARAKLKAIGDSCFIEYVFQAIHVFTAASAPNEAASLSKRFLEIGASEDPAYILTDYTMRRMPTGAAWARTKAGLSNYVKLCDQNYYWETSTARKHYLNANVTAKKHTVPMAGLDGYFIPISGYGGGTGAFSVKLALDGAPGFNWTAKVDLDACKTEIEAVQDSRVPPTQTGKERKTLTVREANQNAETEVEFVQPKVGDIPKEVSAAAKLALEQWLTARFAANLLRAHGNKISLTVVSESGNDRRDARHRNVVKVLNDKLAQLRTSHSISVHPGLDNSGVPLKGTLTRAVVNMAESTRQGIVIDMPDAAPGDPGKLAGAMDKTHCPIKIECWIESHSEALGLCEGADVLACFSKAQGAVDVCTTLHELGHSYGMTVFTAGDKPAKGMARPKKITEAETVDRYKDVGTLGNYYDAHEHSGSHCAFGLSDDQKNLGDYQAAGYSAAAKCIMFGSGGRNRVFCPQCQDLIRGTNLTVLPVVPGS